MATTTPITGTSTTPLGSTAPVAPVAPTALVAPATTTPAAAGAAPISSNNTIDNPASAQDQMASMIDPNNPYFQKWSTAGKQTAAASGITNGTMQQTGILNSVMQNATPIATASANIASQNAIASSHDANSVLIGNNSAASDAYKQFATNIGNIDSNDKMNADAKTAALGNQQDAFNTAIAGIRASSPKTPDVSSILNVGNVKVQNDLAATQTPLGQRQSSWDQQYAVYAQQLAALPASTMFGYDPNAAARSAAQSQISALGPRPVA